MLFLVLCQGLLDCTCTANWSRGFFSASWTILLSLIHRTPKEDLLKQVGQGTRVGMSRKGCRHLSLALLLNALYPGRRGESRALEREVEAGGCHIPALLFVSSPCIPAAWLSQKEQTGLVCQRRHVRGHTDARAIIARHGDADLYFACCPYSTRSCIASMAQGKWETCPRRDVLTLSNLSWEETSGAKGPTL